VGELRLGSHELPQLLDPAQCKQWVDEVLPPVEEPLADGGLDLDLSSDVTLGSAADD
jgi:hypothetical protein